MTFKWEKAAGGTDLNNVVRWVLELISFSSSAEEIRCVFDDI